MGNSKKISDFKKKKLEDNKYIENLGHMRYRKLRHANNEDVDKKGLINEKFVEKLKKFGLTKEELKHLYNLEITTYHEIPLQHQIEHQAGSRIPNKKEREEFEKICPIKKGPFSLEEDRIIISNWKLFCKRHNWDILKPAPFLQFRYGGKTIIPYLKKRIKFVQTLANGLPNRTLYSVYHRFRNLQSNHRVNKYSQEEDQKILDHLNNCSGDDSKIKYSILAEILGRTRMSVYRRCKILTREQFGFKEADLENEIICEKNEKEEEKQIESENENDSTDEDSAKEEKYNNEKQSQIETESESEDDEK